MIRFQIGDQAITPIEISAEILRSLKHLAEKNLGEKVEKAVITVPAYFNDSQRQATKFAGELAGLEVARIVNEPTAACLAYGLDKKAAGLVAVFDLGGGTFDISILRITGGVFEVLATNGDTALGGDDFDHALVDLLKRKLAEAGVALDFSPTQKTDLLLRAEALKRALSDQTEAELKWPSSAGETSVRISRRDFEQAITPLLERVRGPVTQALADAGFEARQVSDVILVGGSTRVPLVKSFVQSIFGREPICTLNPDEVVAMGATIQANILAGQMGGMLLLDVVPLSLGIETMGGVVTKIIHRNSTVPTSATEHFSTYVEGQTKVAIQVVQGERELAQDNRALGRFELQIPPLPAGIPKIEVEFIIDANGILSVKAVELRTLQSASITVNPSYGLSDTEVESMLMASFDHAESDFEKRFLIEAKVESDSLIRTTKKALTTAGQLLSATDRQAIDQAIIDLESSLSGKDREKIKAAMEHLSKITEPFAQALLNQAVNTALKDKEI